MDYRTKNCPTCGSRFSYAVNQGTDRKHCNAACRQVHQLQLREDRVANMPRCSVEGCTQPAKRVGAGLCEACYCRERRTGSTARRIPTYRYVTKSGYVKLKCEHPLATPNGEVYEHRAVAFASQGGRALGCYWCGQSLTWSVAVVDHLNEQKADNRPDNLVVSCNDCNRARGALIPFVRRLSPDALRTFIRAVVEVNGQSNASAKLTA